mgnify:CR=1 FL=1|tara:strand:- start:1459 stop:1896 length:438 start_codon:yes stop_codon:yes gene_type:complete
MTLTLYNISKSRYLDEKRDKFAKYLSTIFNGNTEDYKILGKYTIDKHARLTISLMSDIDERYHDECTLCCDEIENNESVEQFQTLFEIVRECEGIPDSLVKGMDDPNKKVAEVWNNQGVDAAVEVMTRGMRDGTMSYAQMRELYG